ncbi:hypothetical protein MY04_0062 [Flammeovirga sp. MY04]|uniref:hypothetical protein n=1 Tax=Flammeovirga sp. MY04 TaxID=1191459 RepID=UPI00080609A7|nr:hypothetical protein [Flammeovirga sp. MY04]ANQ47445.1 hypothetical protein MY04_0062 [Flammeovirga sp. MY04]
MAILFASLFMGCEKADLSPKKATDVSWYTSQFRKGVWNVGLNEHTTFMNLSQNYVDNKWEIEPTLYFLDGSFPEGAEDLTPYIREDLDRETADLSAHVLFTEPGLKKVRMYTTFPDSVTFKGNDTLPSFFDPNINLWVIDTTFVIDVYDTLKPELEVYINDILQKPNSNPEVIDTLTFEAGTLVKFVDVTTQGRPNSRTWNLEGARPSGSTEQEVEAMYVTEGVFTASLASARTGTQIPNANAWMKVPFIFNVTESTQSFTALGTASELANETITIPLNMESSPFTGQEDSFVVRVENEGFNEVIPVALASLDNSDKTLITLKLTQPIYNTDKITVSYTGGNISNSNGKLLSTFEDIEVEMHVENLLDAEIFGFEKDHGNWTFMDWAWGPAHTFVDTKAYSGFYSMKLEALGGNNFTYNKVTIPETKAGKKYMFTYKAWVDASTNTKSFKVIRNEDWKQVSINDFDQVPREQWVDLKHNFDGLDGPNTFMFAPIDKNDGAWGGDLLIYIDDVQLIELEIRP